MKVDNSIIAIRSGKESSITIDGKTYRGKKVVAKNNKVYVDDKLVDDFSKSKVSLWQTIKNFFSNEK